MEDCNLKSVQDTTKPKDESWEYAGGPKGLNIGYCPQSVTIYIKGPIKGYI